MTDARHCRRNGWGPGTVLQGTESGPGWSSTARIRITAIGERSILARMIWLDGKSVCNYEGLWTLEHRRWRRVRS